MTLLIQYCTFFPWTLIPQPVQKLKQVVIVDLGFLFGVGKNQGMARKGTKSIPSTRVSSPKHQSCICLQSNVCLLSAQGVNGAFMSLSGLGQDTNKEKNNCLNLKLFNSQRLFQKHNSSRMRDLYDIRQLKSLPARPFALVEHVR